jgi:hypothetical protein
MTTPNCVDESDKDTDIFEATKVRLASLEYSRKELLRLRKDYDELLTEYCQTSDRNEEMYYQDLLDQTNREIEEQEHNLELIERELIDKTSTVESSSLITS